MDAMGGAREEAFGRRLRGGDLARMPLGEAPPWRGLRERPPREASGRGLCERSLRQAAVRAYVRSLWKS
eukprot:15455891-Alexandrium_andersonii.AAC.1